MTQNELKKWLKIVSGPKNMDNTKICHLELVGLLKVSKTKFLKGEKKKNGLKVNIRSQIRTFAI